jgi:hypothetical protein
MSAQKQSEKSDVLLCTVEGAEIELICNLSSLEIFNQLPNGKGSHGSYRKNIDGKDRCLIRAYDGGALKSPNQAIQTGSMRGMEKGCIKTVGNNPGHEVGDFVLYGKSIHNGPGGPLVKGINDHICSGIQCFVNRCFIDLQLSGNDTHMGIEPPSIDLQ